MELYAIIKHDYKSLEMFDPSSISFDTIKKSNGITERYSVIVKDSENVQYDVNISKLLSHTSLGLVSSWDEFFDQLTESQVMGYKAYIPWLPYIRKIENDISTYTISSLQKRRTHPNVFYLNNDDRFVISYGSINNPDTRNIPAFKFHLPDLIVTPDPDNSEVNSINLHNCFFSINGIVHNTTVVDEEVYLLDSTKNVYGTEEYNYPEVVMVDLSPLGDVTKVSFNECTHQYINSNTAVLNAELEIFLPETIDLSDKTLIMVIAGKPYFPDELTLSGKRSLRLNLSELPIQNHLMYKAIARGDYIQSTNIVEQKVSTIAYIESLWNTKSDDAFFMIIDNKDVYVSREATHYTIDPNVGLRFNTNTSRGIIYDKYQREIRSCTFFNYTTGSFYDLNYKGIKLQPDTRVNGIEYIITAIDTRADGDYIDINKEAVYEVVFLVAP